MAGDIKQTLDLDELFGKDKPIIVKWGGKEYRMVGQRELSPKKSVQYQSLVNDAATLQSFGDGDISNEQAEVLENAINNALMIICEPLAKTNMPFMAKVEVIKFYTAQINPDPDAEADADPHADPKVRPGEASKP